MKPEGGAGPQSLAHATSAIQASRQDIGLALSQLPPAHSHRPATKTLDWLSLSSHCMQLDLAELRGKVKQVREEESGGDLLGLVKQTLVSLTPMMY